MDNTIELTTEQKILNAAIEIFVKDGYDGARMQAIADKAEINKAMLHYYFRSKELLFEKVFELSYMKMQPNLTKNIIEGSTVYEIICCLVDIYLDFLDENPFLPGLIISTMNHNPEFTKKIPRAVPTLLFAKMEKAMKNKEIKKVDPSQIMTSVISLCMAPYAAKKMMMHMSGMNEKEYSKLLFEKRAFIKGIVKHMLH